jgi:hypothetical protein
LGGADTSNEREDSVSEPPDYKPKLFLNREQEIALFRDLLDRVASGRAGRMRTLVLEGQRGIGKSWLLRHFHHLAESEMHEKPGTCIAPFLIRFKPDPQTSTPRLEFGADGSTDCIVVCALNQVTKLSDQPQESAKEFMRQVLQWLADRFYDKQLIETALAPIYSAGELSDLLTRLLERRLNAEKAVVILLVDSVYEADWEIVRVLEDYVLAPLLALDRVAVVLSGRGRPFPWVNSLLRVEPKQDVLKRWEKPKADVDEGRQRKLLIDLIRKQLPKDAFWRSPLNGASDSLTIKQEERIEQIWELGQGHPLLTLSLAARADQDDAFALEQFLEHDLFLSLPENRRPILRACFEALSVLDFFRETEMEEMLKAYAQLNAGPAELAAPQTRNLLTELQRTYLLRWDRQQSQYVVDDTVRITLSTWLRLEKLQLWKSLHRAAQSMFEQWALDFSVHRAYYEERAFAHQLALNRYVDGERTTEPQQTKEHLHAVAMA